MMLSKGLARGFLVVLALAAAPALSGCSWLTGSSDEPKEATYQERPIDQIYSAAWKKVRSGDWNEAGKQFAIVPYTQKTHGLAGPVRRHLYETMTAFFEDALK